MMKKKTMMTCLMMICALSVGAQEQVRRMSLDDLFSTAETNSQQLRISMTAIESAGHALSNARSQQLPDISAQLSVGYLGDGLLGDRSFKNWTHVSNPHFMNSFALSVQQTIYAGGAIKSGIRMAELGKRQGELTLERNREEVRFLLAGHFLDLCRLHNQRMTIEENLVLTDSLISNMQARVSQGAALQTDITRYELQREQLRLRRQQVDDNCQIINHRIVTTLHLPAGTTIEPDTTALRQADLLTTLGDWQQTASLQSTSLKMADNAISMSEQQLKMSRSALLPKVAVVAEEHFDGPITIEVPVIDKNFNYWFAGVGVQYNLSSLFKGNKSVRKAKSDMVMARQQRLEVEEQVDNAVMAAYTQMQTAQTELRTQQKQVQLAREHYDVTRNRFQNGLCLLTDMLDASSTRLSSELALVNARINMLYQYYKLKYTTSTL